MYSVGCCLCGGGGRASSKLYSHIYRRPGGNVYFPGLTVATHSYSNTPAHSASLISYFVWLQSGVLAYDIGYICLYCTNILLAHQYCFGVISNLWPRELITNQVWFPRQQIVNPKWLPRQLITNPKSWPWQQISNQYWCIMFTLLCQLWTPHAARCKRQRNYKMSSTQVDKPRQSVHNTSILVGNLLPWSRLWVGDQLPWQPLWVNNLLCIVEIGGNSWSTILLSWHLAFINIKSFNKIVLFSDHVYCTGKLELI